MITPIDQGNVRGDLYDPQYSPRPMCKYTKIKKNEATLACRYRISQPQLTSRMICSTLMNAKSTEGVQCIASVTPVMIWIPKHAPNSEPKFHMYDKLAGCGESTM